MKLMCRALLYFQVRAANHERQQLSRLQRKEIGLAVMLLVVVSVFFICNVLAFIINVLELMDIVIDELTMVSNLLVTINSSVNFIIYCIFGQKFRKVFLKMFCVGVLSNAVGRGGPMDSGIYGQNSVYGESRTVTNGKTQTIRMSSWNGSYQSGRSLPSHNVHGHHGHSCHGTSWRTSRYSSVPLGDPSTPRTSSSFTQSRNQSLVVPPRTPAENVHVLWAYATQHWSWEVSVYNSFLCTTCNIFSLLTYQFLWQKCTSLGRLTKDIDLCICHLFWSKTLQCFSLSF